MNTLRVTPKEKKIDKLSVMDQYLTLKKEAGSQLLFFQMGDFYELFYEDAKKASRLLGLTLTQRGTSNKGEPIPMCGIPLHAANNYLVRLLNYGEHVAICDQVENVEEAKLKRGYKAIVKRKIIRILTPATVLEDDLIPGADNNFLASIGYQKQKNILSLSLAWTDISTGDCFSSQDTPLNGTLSGINPKEILIPETLLANKDIMETLSPWRTILQPWPNTQFQPKKARSLLEKAFAVPSLELIGNPSPPTLMALGMMCNYIVGNIKEHTITLKIPQSLNTQHYMTLGGMIHQHLELTSSSLHTSKGSVLHTIARTKTSQGYRLLARRLVNPLCQRHLILERQEQISWCLENQDFLHNLQSHLAELPDLERSLARIAHKKGHPRDLHTLRQSLSLITTIQNLIRKKKNNLALDAPPLFSSQQNLTPSLLNLHDHLERSLINPFPLKPTEGQRIRQGYASDIDALRNKKSEQQRHIHTLEHSYRSQTGVDNLRIKNNQASGFFIEVNPRFAPKLTPLFIHKQNLANAVRYTTNELQDLDNNINTTSQNLVLLEDTTIQNLLEQSRHILSELQDLSLLLSEWDWAASHAQLALENHYVKPEIIPHGTLFSIKEGRHPVIEPMCKHDDTFFTANNCHLHQDDRIWLLSGPNMAGKSTFLRQNALIAILAHNGAFVPATHARMSIIKSLFSRVGANDDIAQGRSTFMVEMLDVATILHQAGPNSLIILDEVGRGTATYDGLAIAQASLEYIHNHMGSLCIFASHYHELNTLPSSLPALSNHTMKVEEHKGQVIFLHHVIDGTCLRSYGIHVASLAGVPREVIRRASDILHQLENQNEESLPLFANLTPSSPPPSPPSSTPPTIPTLSEHHHTILQALKALDTNELSPREAFELICSLQEQINNPSLSDNPSSPLLS